LPLIRQVDSATPASGRPEAGPMLRCGSPRGGRLQRATLRLLQLTDMHLYGDPKGLLLGQNTRRTLELVIDRAIESFWPVDRVLLTGDLVHDESPAGYAYLQHRISELGAPCNSLPGNHDSPGLMAGSLDGGPISVAPAVRCGAWNLIFLTSAQPGADAGHLDDGQLHLLETALAAHPRSHALVCLHHQPVPVGSTWLDTMALDNPDDFFAVIDRHPQVRGILWGHIHQEYEARRNGVLLMGSPSTCVQFLPTSAGFALDALTPGFRWLELSPDGHIATGVQRIAAYPDPLDLSSLGY